MPNRVIPFAPQDEAAVVPEDLRAVFGGNLRAARCAQNLSQRDLGDRAGFKNQYISRVEDGQINLTIKTMERLAAALGQDMRVLLASPLSDQNQDDSQSSS
jgi:transcriptional regulator with XRE-family HTH domain